MNPAIIAAIDILTKNKWSLGDYEQNLLKKLNSLSHNNFLPELEEIVTDVRHYLMDNPEYISDNTDPSKKSYDTSTLQKVFSKLIQVCYEEYYYNNDTNHYDNKIHEYHNALIIGRENLRLFPERFNIAAPGADTLLSKNIHLSKPITNIILGHLIETQIHSSQLTTERILDLYHDSKEIPGVVIVDSNSYYFYSNNADNPPKRILIPGLTNCECLILKDRGTSNYWIMHVMPSGNLKTLTENLLIDKNLDEKPEMDALIINRNSGHSLVLATLQKRGITAFVNEYKYGFGPGIDLLFSPEDNQIAIYSQKYEESRDITNIFPAPGTHQSLQP